MIGAEDLKRRLADSFENNRSFPLITRKTLTGALIDRYESGLITPPRRPQISGMDAIRGKFIYHCLTVKDEFFSSQMYIYTLDGIELRKLKDDKFCICVLSNYLLT